MLCSRHMKPYLEYFKIVLRFSIFRDRLIDNCSELFGHSSKVTRMASMTHGQCRTFYRLAKNLPGSKQRCTSLLKAPCIANVKWRINVKIGVVEQKQIQRISTIACQPTVEKKESKCLSPDWLLHDASHWPDNIVQNTAKSILVFSNSRWVDIVHHIFGQLLQKYFMLKLKNNVCG